MSGEFRLWLDGFRLRAQTDGISAAVLDRALEQLGPNADVVEKDRNQAEFTRTIQDYLETAVSEQRVADGRRALTTNTPLLERIAVRYGVPATIVTAIWGLESAYGKYRGAEPVIASLATLACDSRRSAFFEAELVAALRIVQSGEITLEALVGSWAGAMGHTQFMPSTWLEHSVDFDGDGRRDIWSEDPTDALASTAAYLASSGWRTGEPWGGPVALPDGFDFGLAGRQTWKPVREWTTLDVRSGPESTIAEGSDAAILLPAGYQGQAFLISRNFEALRRYNAADSYVLAVGLLSDALSGLCPGTLRWPNDLRLPDRAGMAALQAGLSDAGYDTQGADGLAGPNTARAIRAYQQAEGLPADGFATMQLLQRLRLR